MQLDDIEVILSVAETRSLSQAAERLYMSRPGLSQRLTKIEQRYGTQLFNRTSSGVSPTTAGAIVIKFARRSKNLKTPWRQSLPRWTSILIRLSKLA